MISIVIPAYNEEKYIGACLEALAAQTTTEPFEVIVVDNNSTDRTAAVAKTYRDKLNLRVIFEPLQRRGSARRRGFAEAKGNIIFSTDADSRPHPDWIESYTRVLREENVDAVTSTALIDDCHPVVNGIVNGWYFLFLQLYRANNDHWLLPGANFAVRASAYRQTQGFQTQSDIGEDIEFSVLMSKIGKVKFLYSHALPISGRRFANGLVQGAWTYVKPNVEKRLLKKKNAVLCNVR